MTPHQQAIHDALPPEARAEYEQMLAEYETQHEHDKRMFDAGKKHYRPYPFKD